MAEDSRTVKKSLQLILFLSNININMQVHSLCRSTPSDSHQCESRGVLFFFFCFLAFSLLYTLNTLFVCTRVLESFALTSSSALRVPSNLTHNLQAADECLVVPLPSATSFSRFRPFVEAITLQDHLNGLTCQTTS
jgi:hypothetical protein